MCRPLRLPYQLLGPEHNRVLVSGGSGRVGGEFGESAQGIDVRPRRPRLYPDVEFVGRPSVFSLKPPAKGNRQPLVGTVVVI